MQTMRPSDLVIAGIRKDLRRYATAGKIKEPSGEGSSIDPFGVQVLFSRKRGSHEVMFRGVTHDNIEWRVQVDFRAYSREYHETLIQMVSDHIVDERRRRRGRDIILLDDIEPAELIH